MELALISIRDLLGKKRETTCQLCYAVTYSRALVVLTPSLQTLMFSSGFLSNNGTGSSIFYSLTNKHSRVFFFTPVLTKESRLISEHVGPERLQKRRIRWETLVAITPTAQPS